MKNEVKHKIHFLVTIRNSLTQIQYSIWNLFCLSHVSGYLFSLRVKKLFDNSESTISCNIFFRTLIVTENPSNPILSFQVFNNEQHGSQQQQPAQHKTNYLLQFPIKNFMTQRISTISIILTSFLHLLCFNCCWHFVEEVK